MTKKTTSKRKKKTAAKKVEEQPSVDENAVIEAPQAKEQKADDMPEAPQVDTEQATEARIETPPEEPPKQSRRGTGFVGWLAFFLASGALAGTAYLLFENWRAGSAGRQSDAAVASLRSTVDATRDALSSLGRRLDEMSSRDLASTSELQSLERRLNESSQNLESLPGRVSVLEGSIASLQGISRGAREAWLLAEAEYYMQIANAQLQLAGNPQLAALALRFADERLLQLANPALTEVRRKLSDELRAIDNMEKPDIEGVTLTLASLAGVVDSLPLRQEVGSLQAESDEVDPELSGLDRAFASLKRAVGDVISVRRTDEAAVPLTAPDAVYFLRANLALQLQAARLALLRNERAIFEASLDDASSWLGRFYDTESAPVQSALDTIAEIRNGLISISPPDISGSLRLLRRHVALSGSEAPAPSVDPAPETDREPEPES